MESYDLEQVRAIARSLARRVQEDSDFAEQVREDPFAVLSAAGLPEAFMQEFLEQTQLSEVSGYGSLSCGLTVIL